MSNQTRPNSKKTPNLLEKLKGKLLRRQREVEQEIKAVEKEDPLFSDDLAESTEVAAENWLAEVHGKTVAVRYSLNQMLGKIKNSLHRIKKGEYGKCENCGKMIEPKRLEAMPTATLCIACSKKKTR